MEKGGPTIPALPPDWAAVVNDVHCPLCEYNLRGLVEPRCPECGYSFHWPDILEPHRNHHPYLFEHHPRRNFWSFRRTLFASFRPLKFWRSLEPFHPLVVRRLVVYLAICMSVPLVGILLTGVRVVERRWFRSFAFVPFDRMLDSSYFHESLRGCPGFFSAIVVVVVGACWPVLTFLALLIFQGTMAKARIRPAQIMRCVTYNPVWSIGAGLVAVGGFAAAQAWSMGNSSDYWFSDWFIDNLGTMTVLAAVLLWCAATWNLTVAYRRYLRFPAPLATVLLSQITIGVPIGLIAYILYMMYGYR